MSANILRFAKRILIITLVSLISLPAQSFAEHVVSSAELQKSIQAAADERKSDLKAVHDFLSSPEHAKFLEKNSFDVEKLRVSAQLLSDEELAQLAQKARNAQNDFAAGALSNRDLLLILLGIAVILLIIAVAD